MSRADLTIWGNFWLFKLKAKLYFCSQIHLWFHVSPHSDPRQSCDPACETGRSGIHFPSIPPPSLGCSCQGNGRKGMADIFLYDWPWSLPKLMQGAVGILPRALQAPLTTQHLWCRSELSPGSNFPTHLLAPMTRIQALQTDNLPSWLEVNYQPQCSPRRILVSPASVTRNNLSCSRGSPTPSLPLGSSPFQPR